MVKKKKKKWMINEHVLYLKQENDINEKTVKTDIP